MECITAHIYYSAKPVSDQLLLVGTLINPSFNFVFRFLEESINKDGEIRKQDSHAAFYTVGYGSVGFFVARDFLFSRINDIVE